MKKIILIFGLGIISLCLIVVGYDTYVERRDNPFAKFVSGPEFLLDGHAINSQVPELQPAADSRRLFVFLEKPEFLTVDQMLKDQTLIHICEAIAKDNGLFASVPRPVEGLFYIHTNILDGLEAAFANDLTLIIENGNCLGGYFVPEASEENTRISKHEVSDEILAVVAGWGMKLENVSIRTTNGQSSIQGEYSVKRQFGRELDTVESGALCITTLGVVRRESISAAGLTSPDEIDRLHVQIVRIWNFGLLYFRTSYGGATFRIENGKCIEQVKV